MSSLSAMYSTSDTRANLISQMPSTAGSAFSVGSSTSTSTHLSLSGTSPRVQLVPHVHRLSHDSSLSQSEKEILDSTSFDARDLSSKDFDFEDIFTYDRPQQKSSAAVDVSPTSREKEWSSFSFSHYTPAATIRQKVNRTRSGIGEMYVKNRVDAQKR